MAFDSNQLFKDAAVTADGNSTALQLGPGEYDITCRVTAVSGTSPTMDVTVAESDDNSTYNTLATFPQMTAKGQWHRKVKTQKKYLRLAFDVGGTSPSFTITAGPTIGRDGGSV